MITELSTPSSQPNSQQATVLNRHQNQNPSSFMDSFSNSHARNNKVDNIVKQTIFSGLQANLQEEKNCFERIIDCLRDFFHTKKKQKKGPLIIVNSDNIMDTLQKLKNTERNATAQYVQNGFDHKKILVLGLQGTLVYSSRKKLENYNFQYCISKKNPNMKIYTQFRYGLDIFLTKMSKIYQIIVYTTTPKQYAYPIIQQINKNRTISQFLYRSSCINFNNMYFLKTMANIRQSPNKIIFIDSNNKTGILQSNNFLQVIPYKGDADDRQLIKLIPFLQWINQKQNVKPVCERFGEYLENYLQSKNNKNQEQEKQIVNLEQLQQKQIQREKENLQQIQLPLFSKIEQEEQVMKHVSKLEIQYEDELKENTDKKREIENDIQNTQIHKNQKEIQQNKQINLPNQVQDDENKVKQLNKVVLNQRFTHPSLIERKQKIKSDKRSSDTLSELSLNKTQQLMKKRYKLRGNSNKTTINQKKWLSNMAFLKTDSTNTSFKQQSNQSSVSDTRLRNQCMLNTLC